MKKRSNFIEKLTELFDVVDNNKLLSPTDTKVVSFYLSQKEKRRASSETLKNLVNTFAEGETIKKNQPRDIHEKK